MNVLSTIIIGSILFIGCKPKNPDLHVETTTKPLPAAPKDIRYQGPQSLDGQKPTQVQAQKVTVPPTPPRAEPDRYTQVDDEIFKPKVDILFVMDTSDSMKDDQKNLKNNIKLFSSNFLNKKQFLDFHIGVVTAWDSISFAQLQKDCAIGQLRPLGGKSGPFKGSCTAAQNEVPYITNQTELDENRLNAILGSTLSFGVEPFIRDQKTKKVVPESGPQHEELFSPVIEALSEENSDLNKKFRRKEAHLAVIFFTDTDDFDYLTIEDDAKAQDALNGKTLEDVAKTLDASTRQELNVTPEMLATKLKSQQKDNATVSVYAALGRYNEWIQTNGNTQGVYRNADYYIQQPGRGPKKMVELLNLTQGIGFDLRDRDYGAKLSEIGNDIVSKTLRRTITLDFAPEINPKRPIIVRYGKNQIIAKDDKKGWSYNIENGKHIITVSENIQIQPEAGARLSVEYTPVKK